MAHVSPHSRLAPALIFSILLMGAACTKIETQQNANIPNDTNTTTNTSDTLNTNVAAENNTNRSTTNTAGDLGSQIQTLTVAEALAQPTLYHDQPLCLQGYYQNSFEFNALSAERTERTRQLRSPYIWVELPDSAYTDVSKDCTTDPTRGKECFSRDLATLCGTFRYSATPAFGHAGAYSYLLDD